MKQGFTSAATSINCNRLPAVYRKVVFPFGSVIFDYGCGRYIEHIRKAVPDCDYLPYDPYNQPQSVNRESIRFLEMARQQERSVTVICSNVLNVIDSDEEVRSVLQNIAAIVSRTYGKAYITVYEGDKSGDGRQTGPDQWQRNEKTASYLRFMPYTVHAYTCKNMIVMEVPS